MTRPHYRYPVSWELWIPCLALLIPRGFFHTTLYVFTATLPANSMTPPSLLYKGSLVTGKTRFTPYSQSDQGSRHNGKGGGRDGRSDWNRAAPFSRAALPYAQAPPQDVAVLQPPQQAGIRPPSTMCILLVGSDGRRSVAAQNMIWRGRVDCVRLHLPSAVFALPNTAAYLP